MNFPELARRARYALLLTAAGIGVLVVPLVFSGGPDPVRPLSTEFAPQADTELRGLRDLSFRSDTDRLGSREFPFLVAPEFAPQADTELAGSREFSSFVIPHGVTVTVTDDLEVLSSAGIVIAGALLAAERPAGSLKAHGIDIALRTPEEIVIEGEVVAGRGPDGGQRNPVSEPIAVDGGDGGSLHLEARIIRSDSDLRAGRGGDGYRGGHGGNGGSSIAIGEAFELGDEPVALVAGDGGAGGHGVPGGDGGNGGSGGAAGIGEPKIQMLARAESGGLLARARDLARAVASLFGRSVAHAANGAAGPDGTFPDTDFGVAGSGGTPGGACAIGGTGGNGFNGVGGAGGDGGDGGDATAPFGDGGNGGTGGRGGSGIGGVGGQGGDGGACCNPPGSGGPGGPAGDGGDGFGGSGGTGGNGGAGVSGAGGNAGDGGEGGFGRGVTTLRGGDGGRGLPPGHGGFNGDGGFGIPGAEGGPGSPGAGTPPGSGGTPGGAGFSEQGDFGPTGDQGPTCPGKTNIDPPLGLGCVPSPGDSLIGDPGNPGPLPQGVTTTATNAQAIDSNGDGSIVLQCDASADFQIPSVEDLVVTLAVQGSWNSPSFIDVNADFQVFVDPGGVGNISIQNQFSNSQGGSFAGNAQSGRFQTFGTSNTLHVQGQINLTGPIGFSADVILPASIDGEVFLAGAPVPALGQRELLVLALVLFGVGSYVLKRRTRSEAPR